MSARKCETRDCDAEAVLPRPATPREQIEFSTGRVPCLVWECVCEWKRIVIMADPQAGALR